MKTLWLGDHLGENIHTMAGSKNRKEPFWLGYVQHTHYCSIFYIESMAYKKYQIQRRSSMYGRLLQ